jgi:hypothetical protein
MCVFSGHFTNVTTTMVTLNRLAVVLASLLTYGPAHTVAVTAAVLNFLGVCSMVNCYVYLCKQRTLGQKQNRTIAFFYTVYVFFMVCGMNFILW